MLTPRRVAVASIALIVLFIPLGIAFESTNEATMPRWLKEFNLDGEFDLPVLFNGVMQCAAGAIAILLAAESAARDRVVLAVLGAFFIFMGVDDMFIVHEHVHSWTGVHWQIVYLPFVAVGAWAWGHTILSWGVRSTASRLLIAGAACWGVAQVLELAQWDDENSVETIVPLMIVEEVLEMAGAVAFAVALLIVVRKARARRNLESQAA
jgi:hypothetical protein